MLILVKSSRWDFHLFWHDPFAPHSMPNVDRRGGNPSHQIEDILVGYQKRAQNNLFLIIKKLGKDLKKIIFEHFLPKKSLKNDIFKDNSKCGMCGIKREPKTISSWLLWNFERILTKKIIFRICLPKNKSKIDIFKQNSKCGTCGISKESPKHYVFLLLWNFERILKKIIFTKSPTQMCVKSLYCYTKSLVYALVYCYMRHV